MKNIYSTRSSSKSKEKIKMMARVKLKLVSILGIIIVGLVNCGNALPAIHHRNSESDRLLTDFSDATVSDSPQFI